MATVFYSAGLFVDSYRLLTTIALVALLSACTDGESVRVRERARRAEVERVAVEVSEKAARRRAEDEAVELKFRVQAAESCKSSGDKMKLASYEMKAGKPQRAFEALQDCRDYLNDPPVKALYLKSMAMARVQDVAKSAADTKRVAAAERVEKKNRGVYIGMTQQEVIHSSWGKPHQINRTIMAHGTHEQWVYRIGSYLYFEDGILSAIQN